MFPLGIATNFDRKTIMPIAKEILGMFDFSRNPKIALSVDNQFDKCTLSQ